MESRPQTGFFYTLVRLLLEQGANPAHTNLKGKTALDIAKADGYIEIMELLQNAKP